MAAVGAGGAVAKTCPNSSTSTVTGTPSYTYTRGCIVSYDGTAIVYNLFEPLHPAARSVYPILEGPGWGGAGDTSPDPQLISSGYAELTWDPRGFGQSGGVAEVDAPSAEGRDVSALIDRVLTGRPEIATDRAGRRGQPRHTNDNPSPNSHGQPGRGMTGGDGGMQVGGYDPNLHYAQVTGAALGYPDRQMTYWFGQRSQAVYGAGRGGHIGDVPTLLIQGTVDTLFNLNDAWANFAEITGR